MAPFARSLKRAHSDTTQVLLAHFNSAALPPSGPQSDARPPKRARMYDPQVITPNDLARSSIIAPGPSEALDLPLSTIRDHPALASSRLSTSSITVLHQIGKGGFGLVGKCLIARQTGCFAVKVVKSPNITDKYECWTCMNEIKAMRAASALPYSTKLFGSFIQDEKVVLIMELCSRGSLNRRLSMENGIPESHTRECRILFLQMASSVIHLHSKGIIHRDVKLENFLIDNLGNVKLSDYGTATVGLSVTRGLNWGTPGSQAPEVATNGSATIEGDLWSLGVCYYKLVDSAHQDPFPLVLINGEWHEGEAWTAFLATGALPKPDVPRYVQLAKAEAVWEYAMLLIQKLMALWPPQRPSLMGLTGERYFRSLPSAERRSIQDGKGPAPFKPYTPNPVPPNPSSKGTLAFWRSWEALVDVADEGPVADLLWPTSNEEEEEEEEAHVKVEEEVEEDDDDSAPAFQEPGTSWQTQVDAAPTGKELANELYYNYWEEASSS